MNFQIYLISSKWYFNDFNTENYLGEILQPV